MNTINIQKPNKNKFDLSREVKQTGNMGALMPCFIQDVVPGDSLRVNTQHMIRLAPLLAPIMQNIDFKLDYFFVPYRLVWKEWKDFITGGADGNDLPSYPRFTVSSANIAKGSLHDYLGIPPASSSSQSDIANSTGYAGTDGAWNQIKNGTVPTANRQEIGILHHRAYQLIWSEYFRDQNLEDYTPIDTSGLQDSTGDYLTQTALRYTTYAKDYFTSALPFMQRGEVEIELPLGKVKVDDLYNADGSTFNQSPTSLQVSSASDGTGMLGTGSYASNEVYLEGEIDSISINELRKASALQRWLEIMARGGSRYREQILAIFGERIPDYTVQVPQYLGGGKTAIMISEVLSTYASEDSQNDRPQGDMTGHAIGLGDGLGFQQNFDEHGVVLGICRIVPKISYTQGLSPFFQKFDKLDHFFPQFANLGEQEIKKKELYVTGDTSIDDAVFGYQQRYAEYKYAHSRIAGDFRDSLAFWELSKRYNGSAPTLNAEFVKIDEIENNRIFAVQDPYAHKVWMSFYHKVDALRPMPYHSNPTLN